MTGIWFCNLNVGSGIEATGDRIISMLDDYKGEVHVYKHQNPPYLIYNNILEKKPDIIILNEYYPRTMEPVAYYKATYPDTLVILLNHDWRRVDHVPFDTDTPKEEHGLSSHDQVSHLNHAWNNLIDVFINLNHVPDDVDYPSWAKYKTINKLHPIPDEFTITKRWKDRTKHFMHFGVIWPHRLPMSFMESLKGTKMHLDVYGTLREEKTEETKDYNRSLIEHPCVDYKGYIPDEELIDTLNQYRFWLLPCEGTELFCLCMAEAIRCGVIPLVSSPVHNYKSKWADWADGHYFRYANNEEILNRMKYYFERKDDPKFIEDLERFSVEGSTTIRNATDYDQFKKMLYRYV